MTKFDYTTHPFTDTRVKDIDFTDVDLDEQLNMFIADYDMPSQCFYYPSGEELVISHEWEINPVSFLPNEHRLFQGFIESGTVDPDATEEQMDRLVQAGDEIIDWITDWCKERGIMFDHEWLDPEYARWEFSVAEPLDSEAGMREVEERLNPVVNLMVIGSYALHQHLVDWANEQKEVSA